MAERLVAWLCSERGWRAAGSTIAAIALTAALCCMGYSIPKPLLGPHNFRQTQNAISSYYSVKEHGSIFNNVMPVLGRPWDLPTEFPLFQYLAGSLHWMTGCPLDAAGRLLSALFWLATVAMTLPLLRALGVATSDLWIPVVILMSSPLYLFWGATYMMETMALFLATLFVYCVVRCSIAMTSGVGGWPVETTSTSGRMWPWWAAAMGAGLTAALQKGSTWIIAFGVAILLIGWAARRAGVVRAMILHLWLVPLFVVPYLVAHKWFEYGDSLTRANPFVRDMFVFANPKFREWNYGTFDQKISGQTWSMIARHMQEGVLVSIPPFDHLAIVALLIVGAALSRKRRPQIAALMAGFAAGPLIFTNLYYVHNYYMSATGIWLLLALSLAIVGLAEKWTAQRWPRLTAMLLTLVVGGAGFWAWTTGFLPILRSFPTHAQLRAAWTEPVKRLVPSPRTLLILGDDWNPTALYYAECKGIAWPDNMLDEFPGARLAEAKSLLKSDEAIGAVVIHSRLATESNSAGIARILESLEMSKEGLSTPFGLLFPARDLAPGAKAVE
jgi:hypothetical protein